MNYYNDNKQEFYEKSIDVNMEPVIEQFLRYIKPEGYILDAGCGVGRDTKVFVEKGYKVNAFDASIEMCKLAHQTSGIKVKHTTFQEFHSNHKYDGIWACASLLHVERRELKQVLLHLDEYLNERGVLYMSFKEGSEDTMKDDRHFTNMTIDTLKALLQKIEQWNIVECWVSSDRMDRHDVSWVNAIVQKVR